MGWSSNFFICMRMSSFSTATVQQQQQRQHACEQCPLFSSAVARRVVFTFHPPPVPRTAANCCRCGSSFFAERRVTDTRTFRERHGRDMSACAPACAPHTCARHTCELVAVRPSTICIDRAHMFIILNLRCSRLVGHPFPSQPMRSNQ